MSSMLPQFRAAWSASREDLEIGVRRICIGLFMSTLAGVMSAHPMSGRGGCGFCCVSSAPQCYRCLVFNLWGTLSSFILIFVVTRTWSLAPHSYSEFSCTRTSIDLTFLQRLRYFGHAGICPCRFGSETFYFCRWQPPGASCGGATCLL